MEDPLIKNTVQKVFVLEHELAMEKMKSKQLSESMRKMIELAKLPKEEFKWYNLLGGKTMRKGSSRTRPAAATTTTTSRVTPLPATPTSALPGSIGLPSTSPVLRRSRADGFDSTFPVRWLFSESEGSCAPISKRLPGHPDDQCESVDPYTLTAHDREVCEQVSPCGPVRRGGKRKPIKTRKNKKSKRKTRRKV